MKYLVVVLLIVGFLAIRKPEEKPKHEVDPHDQVLQDAFNKAKAVYPLAIVKNAEKILRFETDNFQRNFTFETCSPAMNSFTDNYPYGWPMMDKFWKKNSALAPIGLSKVNDSNSNSPLIVFPTFEAGLFTLCQFLSQMKNNVGRWHSLNVADQLVYAAAVDKMTNGYV